MINVRQATESDVGQVREIFLATYGEAYPYPQYYDVDLLKKMVFSDDTLLLVAEDSEQGRVVGTASVLLEIGALADLVGEFGRLAVHPDFRGHGIGNLLMQGRLERVRGRLHVGVVEPRVLHTFSQKISAAHGFACVGFLPMHLRLRRRESNVMSIQYFGDALKLRSNHPRVIPEAAALADLALEACGLDRDIIVDERTAAYPHADDFELDELTTEGYATLLRYERGRVHRREIFGPVRLHYGLFKLLARNSYYLLARRHGRIVGAVGYTLDLVEKAARIFELISLSDEPVRYLLGELLRKCSEEFGVEYVETYASAYAPAMQRTLLELGFLPVAYAPAMVFHEVERLDALRMAKLLVPLDVGDVQLIDANQPVYEAVTRNFAKASMLPAIAQAVPHIALFAGLNDEQIRLLAGACCVEQFAAGQPLFREGEVDDRIHVLLHGQVRISVAGCTKCLDEVAAGECLGEMALLASAPHSATAIAAIAVESAVLTHEAFNKLVRLRPDIGVVVFRNLATGLSRKLHRTGPHSEAKS